MPRDHTLLSGFVSADSYVLTFSIAKDESRARLVELCKGPWQGDQVLPNSWEITNELTPYEMESAILPLLGPGDRAVYYYLSAKRMFRVILE